MKKTFYVTTAIDYVNAEPHIGHAYQKIVADVIARWKKLEGYDVFFLTGTDEHGKKIARSAEEHNKEPQEFVDEMSQKFKEAWKRLNIEYDRFIRTTDEDHKEIVQQIIKATDDQGDIYLGEYEGLYCVSCEAYYTEKDSVEGNCPVHKKPLENLKEKSYFFRLSKYQDFLLDLYKQHPEFVLPKERRNEVINRVKEGLKDLSISRSSFNWGIPFPLDKKHVTYVWYDALINYYTPTAYPETQKYWPADLHLLGKDNAWFHCVYWPAMLKSVDIPLPKTVYVHGFMTFNGEKISKSLGNAISPNILVDKYGADPIRYFCLRHFPFGQDGDFSEKDLIQRNNSELADSLGNLVQRTCVMINKYFDRKIPKSDQDELIKQLDFEKIKKHFDDYEFNNCLSEIWRFIDLCNKYINDTKPWEEKDKEKLKTILYNLAESLRVIAILIKPFMPETSRKIAYQLNIIDFEEQDFRHLQFGLLKQNILNPTKILFQKIEYEEKQPEVKTMEEPKTPEGIIPFTEWKKFDFRVAEIIEAEDHPDAKKLVVLQIDLGDEKRQIVAGLKPQYTAEELVGKKIIVFTNLQPAKLRGIESNGMLLAAVKDDKVILITPESDIDNGARVE